MKVEGKCHCGQITYEAIVDPEKVTVCHCTDCQMLSGSAYRASAIDAPTTYSLRVGCLQQRALLPPGKQIWCRSALDWAMNLQDVTRLSRQ